MKKVLIILSSLRKNSNSEQIALQFAEGNPPPKGQPFTIDRLPRNFAEVKDFFCLQVAC